jgi:sec-independent protein translocase protein TatC
MPPASQERSFFAHLHELRGRLLKVLAALALCSCVMYAFLDPLLRFLLKPVGRLVFTSPEEAFNARMMLAVMGGFLLALPYTVFQIWRFVASALTPQEQKYVKIFGPLSLCFFIFGVLFGYFVILPVSFNFLLGFASPWMVPMITVDKYISFVGTIIFASGVTFELPLIIAFLARIGIATPEFLRQKRRYAIVSILIASAVLTPPDMVSQLILAAPLMVLYELGIIFSRFMLKRG